MTNVLSKDDLDRMDSLHPQSLEFGVRMSLNRTKGKLNKAKSISINAMLSFRYRYGEWKSEKT